MRCGLTMMARALSFGVGPSFARLQATKIRMHPRHAIRTAVCGPREGLRIRQAEGLLEPAPLQSGDEYDRFAGGAQDPLTQVGCFSDLASLIVELGNSRVRR